MSIRIKPLLVIFTIFLVVFSLIALVIGTKYVPAKQQQVFNQLQSSRVLVPEDINKEEEKIYFTVSENETLDQAVQELNKIIAGSDYTEYSLAVHSNNESEQLIEAWQHLQYYIYEIMGQKKYTDFPTLSNEFSQLYPDIELSISMNEEHVFITLSEDGHELFRLLPLEASQVRMWG